MTLHEDSKVHVSTMKEFYIKLGISVATAVILATLGKLWGLVPNPADYRIPKGAIAAFALTEPPPGWELYDLAKGRFIIGMGSTSSESTNATRPTYKLEEAGGVDAHRLVPDILIRDATGNIRDNVGGTSPYLLTKSEVVDARPPYVALLICRKK